MSEDAASLAGDVAARRGVPARTVLLLAAAAFTSSINIRACDPLLPQIAQGFGVTVGSAAQVVTAFAVGYGLTQLLFGPIGDRHGKYLVVALTTIAAGFATAAGALMPSLPSLTLARFFAGAFAAAAIPLAFAWLGDAVPIERRQPVLARFLSAQMSGIVLGQAAGGALGDFFGWQRVFLIVGTLHCLAGAAMLVELRLNPGAQPPGAAATLRLATLATNILRILRRPWVRILLVTVFIEAFAMYGAFAYIGADLHHRFGLSFSLVGLVMSVYGGGAILYSLSARRLIARRGERGLVLAGGLLMSAGFVALAAAPSALAVPPVMVLLGLAFYMMHNTLQTAATQMAPDSRGLGVSIFAVGLFAGQSLGIALAAPFIDRHGVQPVYLAAAVVLPLIALWFRSRLAQRPKD